MPNIVLGADVQNLFVRMHPNSTYRASLTKNTAWDSAPYLRFPRTDTTWHATLTEDDTTATWANPPGDVATRVHKELAELWVGDQCIAAGEVVKRDRPN